MDRLQSGQLATPVTADDHVQGSPDAVVTLVQYGDYECPYTRMSLHSVHALQREFGEQLRFVYRNFPLEDIHPHARNAAAAAEAADRQGRFWEMHEHLFAHQKALEDADLRNYSVELGMSVDQFERDRTSGEVSERIDRDLVSGDLSGVEGTPTFYVNGKRHDGPYDLDSLRPLVKAGLTSKSE